LYPTVDSVTSVRTAILLVGVGEMRKLVLVSMQDVRGDGYSKSLVASALERAKFCEQLGSFLRRDASALYLLGMLSLLDVMLGLPMREVLAVLPIEGEMKKALLGEKNSMRVALDLLISRERGEWRDAAQEARLHGITEEVASRIHFESAVWAKDTYQQLACF
jgi:EAL and modified HD-GYP domain-containing signal transduction protein